METTGSVQIDYFGVTDTESLTLPDGVSTVELKVLTEGDRREYEKQTTRDMTLQQQGGATIRIDPGLARHSLLENSIVGWSLLRNGEPVPFNSKALRDFLNMAPPAIIDFIHDKVQEINVWTVNEDSIEAMKEERDRLNDQIREAEGRQEGKDD